MKKVRSLMAISFRAKVLVPVIAVMAFLTAVLMWMDNRRTVQQLESDAAQQLATAEAVFKNWQQSRADDLLFRYQILANQPSFKSVAGNADLNTFHDFLERVINDKFANVDVIAVSTRDGQPFPPVTHDPHVDTGSFSKSCADSIAQALNGQPKVDIVRDGDALFDVVSIPIRIGEQSDDENVVGAVSFGVRNSIALEFRQLTHSELILVSEGKIVASTAANAGEQTELLEKFSQFAPAAKALDQSGVSKITFGGEHCLCITGRLAAQNREHNLGYLILSSYEKQLQTLQTSQRIILGASALAILFGAAVVWLLVQRVTAPLRDLRDSAEAVGRGDFSQRVEVQSEDECGELAYVFNQMIENLKTSHEQLETTVDTLKTTQAHLIQSEKLSGIGEFIAGVAHELNNPLTTVMGFSELLQQADADPQHKRQLDMIHKSALRCQKIVQALLSFARRRAPERKSVCLNSLVESAIEILHYQLRTSNIEVITQLAPDLPQAMVDPHQVQQVIVNILNNGRQAIEAHQPKGWIKISSGTTGDFVRLTIQDSGPGILPENLSKIFDPFFTTKEVGQGTGLGLSLCYGIIKEHGGTIVARSRSGEGAAFVIELPVTHELSGENDSAIVLENNPADPRQGAGKKVLVIDDEESILHMVRDALTPCGYEVDIASDGEAGLRQISRKQYDVALCDWKMPGLNGQQIYERLRTINPLLSTRIIFITGDVINEKTRRFFEQQNKVCLPKPFTLLEFRSAIKKILAAG